MKRKIFSKLLMGALLCTSVSAFVSCKDYDDDINANKADIKAAQEQLTTLSSNLTSLQQKLDQEKTALQQELAQAKSQLETQIANAKADLNTAIATKADQSTVDALATRVGNLETDLAATKEAYNAKIEAINNSLATLQGLLEKKADQTYVEQAIATLNAAISGKVSTEDFNTFKADVAKIETNLSNLTTLVGTKADQTAVDKAVDAINKDIAQLQKDLTNGLAQQKKDFDAAVAQLDGKIALKADQSALDALNITVAALSGAVQELVTNINNKADKATVTALETKVDNSVKALNEQISKLVTTEQLNTAIDNVTKAMALMESNINGKIDQKANQAEFAAVKEDLANLRGAFERHNENIALAISDAINTLEKKLMPIIDSKVAQDEFDQTIEDVNAEIKEAQDSIASILVTLAVVDGSLSIIDETLIDLANADGVLSDSIKALRASITNNDVAIKELDVQTKAILGFLGDIENGTLAQKLSDLQSAMSNEIKDSIKNQNAARVAAIAAIGEQISTLRSELQDTIDSNAASIKDLQNKFTNIGKIVDDRINANLNSMRVFIDRILKSIVLRPDTYYGGIEGVSVYTYVLPKEQNENHNGKKGYTYFDRIGSVSISDYGEAQYHVNPSNVDLDNYTIDFYNWVASVKQPAAAERITPTRSGEVGIAPVYTTTKALLAANPNNLKNGILTVPFTANASVIENRLINGQATIASLSLNKQGSNGVADTTVNSDYAIVVPEYGYGLLIGDKTFPVTTRHLDQIGYDGGAVNSSNLHRSFSFLALATTSPTHTIKYDGKFDITAVLESRYVPVKQDYDDEITDTAVYVSHNQHQAIARWNGTTLNKDEDGDASIDKSKVVTMTPATFEKLGFKYEIQPVDYALGTNKTGETVHLELLTDENGHVIAYPRNVTADGQTIKGQTANAAAVGRQPIVCIMVKDKNNNIVSFAYMKFLITQEQQVPEAKEVDFDIKDIWVNCKPFDGRVTWSEIEYHILDQALTGMSKADFDKNYVFDYYAETTQNVDVEGATYAKVTRYGIQYAAKGGKRINEATAFGSIDEEWNLSAQGVEDATTHIIKWSFTADELKAKAEALKNANKLEDKGDYYVNKEPITTWVRYAHKAYSTSDAPAIGTEPTKGAPSIWVKLTIPAGELHVAKGDMGANKILTYWYNLNSKTNATGTEDAYEVRINVPVPVPNASATEKTIGYLNNVNNVNPFDIRYDNLLEEADQEYVPSKRTNNYYSEFTKNLKDFFIGGQLSATVKYAEKFSSISGMKLGVEFILPSKTIGNASFDAATNNGVANSWTVKGYTGATYTLKLNAAHTKIQIAAVNKTKIDPIDLVTLNYDDNATAANRQITVVNYVNGQLQDDILNYKTHNELGERETFTAYLNIKAIDACAPVYWNNMWFNARFLRPLDLEEPKQAVVPDAPNDWHEIDLTDALIVKDWREYYGDRTNSTGGADVKKNIPGVGSVKAFDFAYYQVELDITDGNYYTDANLGTSQRSDVYELGSMPRITGASDATSKNFIKTSQIPNLKLEKISNTKLRYLNNSGVTGGFHVFVPITMTYVYGYQTVRQTKWVTVGVTPSVEQAMIEGE